MSPDEALKILTWLNGHAEEVSVSSLDRSGERHWDTMRNDESLVDWLKKEMADDD